MKNSKLVKGVSVTVITTEPEKVLYGNVNMCYELIQEMKQAVIHVVTKEKVEERFDAIIRWLRSCWRLHLEI